MKRKILRDASLALIFLALIFVFGHWGDRANSTSAAANSLQLSSASIRMPAISDGERRQIEVISQCVESLGNEARVPSRRTDQIEMLFLRNSRLELESSHIFVDVGASAKSTYSIVSVTREGSDPRSTVSGDVYPGKDVFDLIRAGNRLVAETESCAKYSAPSAKPEPVLPKAGPD